MRGTTLTSPFSHYESFQPLRAADRTTIRTGLRRKSFIHFFKPCAMLNSLVRKHISEGRPTSIEHGLSQVGFGKSGGIDVAYRDIVKLLNEARREFVVKIFSAIRYLLVNCFDTAFFICPLGNGKRFFSIAINALCFDFFSGGQRGEILQTKINADTVQRLTNISSDNNINHDIQEPITMRIPRKIRAVFDFALWQNAAIEYAEYITKKNKGIASALQVSAFDWNPAKIFLSAIAKIWTFLLGAGLSILLAYGIDRSRMQTKFFTAPGRKFVQVKSSMPSPTEAQSIFLPVIAEIEYVIHGVRLLIKQAVQRFYSVTIDKNHFCRFRYSSMARRTNSAADNPVLSDSNFRAIFSCSGRYMFVRFMRTSYINLSWSAMYGSFQYTA